MSLIILNTLLIKLQSIKKLYIWVLLAINAPKKVFEVLRNGYLDIFSERRGYLQELSLRRFDFRFPGGNSSWKIHVQVKNNVEEIRKHLGYLSF